MPRHHFAGRKILIVVASLFGASASAPANPAIPTKQSDCEIHSNAWYAKHSLDDGGYIESGFFPAWASIPPRPVNSYRDSETGITFRVESDGRNLTAIGADKKILWVRNPFVDSDMCPYRTFHPFIYWIGAPGGDYGRHYLSKFTPTPDAVTNPRIIKELAVEISHGRKSIAPLPGSRFIGLAFNNSQVGYVNIANGDFYFMGQD